MNRARWVGTSVLRREDERFLTGSGCFTDDVAVANALHAHVLRSEHAHARILRVDTRAARRVAGVRAVLVASDLEAARVQAIPSLNRTSPFALRNRDGSELPLADQYPLAREKVRYLGEPIAFVVAESAAGAQSAAELIEVEYEPLPAAIGIDEALAPTAPRVWDQLHDNQSFHWASGDEPAVAAAFEQAAHLMRIELEYPRVVVAFMEPRAVIASHDPGQDRTTVWAGTQAPHRNRDLITDLLGLEPGTLRIITPDMGGGFGARGALYPELLLVTHAARLLGTTVRWTAARAESFLSDTQARDQRLRAELALDREGRFLALRVEAIWRHGAYTPGRSIWALAPHMAQMICGVYRFPHASFEVRGVFSNTAPVAPLRGVARAEAAYLLERLVDAAARETGRDRLALRRLNLIAPEEMPWRTPMGVTYDSGRFEENLDLTLDAIDAAGFADRRGESERCGKLRGLGVAVYIENTMGAPAEFSEVVVESNGGVVVRMGTQNFGMGHETVFAQVLADALGIDLTPIRVLYGDTDLVRTGAGSHGSRSMRIGGTALVKTADALIAKGKALAADLLEVAVADIHYADGSFTIPGTDRRVGLAEVARFAETHGGELSACHEHEVRVPTFPNGCHACEIEIDPETGAVVILRHAMAADVGRAINPMIVHGQLHGGLGQGLGHVLGERAHYDEESGQLLTGTFMDYMIPRADDLPEFSVVLNEVPTAENPLGVKGAGEGPTTGSPPAMMNAILDALAPLGITDLDMPVTSERIWRALRSTLRR